jgi:hypothetical protein
MTGMTGAQLSSSSPPPGPSSESPINPIITGGLICSTSIDIKSFSNKSGKDFRIQK